jgi:hypothetical protein
MAETKHRPGEKGNRERRNTRRKVGGGGHGEKKGGKRRQFILVISFVGLQKTAGECSFESQSLKKKENYISISLLLCVLFFSRYSTTIVAKTSGLSGTCNLQRWAVIYN